MDRTIRAYSDLRRYSEGFATGRLSLLVVYGAGGTGKSTALRATVPEATLVAGHTSPMELFAQAYRAAGAPIVLDDVDGLLRQPAALGLLKSLCQTERVRKVSWLTSGRYLEDNDVPKEFETSSPVCLLANRWDGRDPNVRALGDRGLVLRFDPSPREVHAFAGTFVEDREVYEHIGALLPTIARLSLRDYRNAAIDKDLGGDWRAGLAESLHTEGLLATVQRILADQGFGSEAERVRAFAELTGKSQATFYRLKARLDP